MFENETYEKYIILLYKKVYNHIGIASKDLYTHIMSICVKD